LHTEIETILAPHVVCNFNFKAVRHLSCDRWRGLQPGWRHRRLPNVDGVYFVAEMHVIFAPSAESS
jgi:hypothetical protein